MKINRINAYCPGKKRIERLAAQLSLKPNLVAEAFNYFKQAVSRHMTQGRNSEHFAAACLYLACRLSANSEQGMCLSCPWSLAVYR